MKENKSIIVILFLIFIGGLIMTFFVFVAISGGLLDYFPVLVFFLITCMVGIYLYRFSREELIIHFFNSYLEKESLEKAKKLIPKFRKEREEEAKAKFREKEIQINCKK